MSCGMYETKSPSPGVSRTGTGTSRASWAAGSTQASLSWANSTP